MEQPQPLVCPTHKSHYIFVFIIALILGGAGGAAYGYQKGFDTAKSLVANSVLAPLLQAPQDMRSLSGIVTAVSGDTITLHTESSNPFEDQNLLIRIVGISGATKIVKLVQKDPMVFQSEMEAFSKTPMTTAEGQVSAIPPDFNLRTAAAVSDIKIGDRVTVTSVQNIATTKEFSADEIQIFNNPVTPTV